MKDKDRNISAHNFREWVKHASDDDLEVFVEEVDEIIYDLELDDFFGTEGLNKRLG